MVRGYEQDVRRWDDPTGELWNVTGNGCPLP